MEKLLNQKEISKLTGLTRHEVFLLLRTGQLFGVKLGKGWRVREDVLITWMDKTFTPPQPGCESSPLLRDEEETPDHSSNESVSSEPWMYANACNHSG